MKTLDDAWNAQNWEIFWKRHSADTAAYWPGQPDPTRGRDAHQAGSEAFFKSIENPLDNNPYRVMFGSSDWTCTIARWKRNIDRAVEGAGSQGPRRDRKAVRAGVLHDCRGEPALRPGRIPRQIRAL
jgi:hypothetical protein